MKPVFNRNSVFHTLLTFNLAVISLFATFPLLAFTDMDGKKDAIANHIGNNKWTVMEIWESNCPACRMHMPDMVKFDGKLKNVRLLGITVDGQQDVGDAEDFILEYDVRFPTLVSNPYEMNAWMLKNVGESFVGTPTFVLFNEEGKLVAAQPGIVSVQSLEKFIKNNSKATATAKK